MCTLALYFRVLPEFPVLVAANRDEHFDRPSQAPALRNGHPRMIAGVDLRAGGTWLGVNEHGLLVGVLNRRINGDTLPPTVARSRGALCMELLHLHSAKMARQRIDADRHRYNPFTIVFADKNLAWVAYNDDAGINVQPLTPGLHVFSSAAQVDLNSSKAARAYGRFATLIAAPGENIQLPRQWLGPLQAMLRDHSLGDRSDNPGDAICVHRETSGTVSASIVFLSLARGQFETFHCQGAPCRNAFDSEISLPIR